MRVRGASAVDLRLPLPKISTRAAGKSAPSLGCGRSPNTSWPDLSSADVAF